MCGICGFLDPKLNHNHDDAQDIIDRMTRTLAHRGPDDQGTWLDPAKGIALGHRRLSILDLSPLGHQPMISACGRYVLIFNGEIYNHAELRQALDGLYPWRGHSDTEILLAALVNWGTEPTLRRLNGMFAFALWDREEQSLTLARDRLGEKPLFYGGTNGNFLFGSELKALRAHPRWEADIDRDALAQYLRLGYFLSPRSVYQGIHKLPPGTWLSLKPDEMAPEPRPYWDAAAAAKAGLEHQFTGSETEATDALNTLLMDAVNLRMHADVPLGAFLSGGIDSTTVVAMMQAQSKRPVKTFSIGFHEKGFNEAEHARSIAEYLGTDHTELYVRPEDSLDIIPKLSDLWDEPFADSSQLPTYLVSAMARRDVTVCLSGDGGDELFAGYSRYRKGRDMWNKIQRLPLPLRTAIATMMRTLSPRVLDRLLGPIVGLLPGIHAATAGYRIHSLADTLSCRRPQDIYQRIQAHWMNPESLVIGATEPQNLFAGAEQLPASASFVDLMMCTDALTYLPDDILVKVDRASMGVSLESRVPLLDHRVYEFAWTLPQQWKLTGNTGKALLRQVLYRHVPKAMVERPKMGFGVPIAAWLRGPLRDWAEDLLDESAMRQEGYLDPTPIRATWHEHQTGIRDWPYQIWEILMFQAWLRHGKEA